MPTLGIIGGGQLGSMLASAAKKINIKTVIFCDDKNAPGQKFSDKFICADYSDDKAKEVLNFITEDELKRIKLRMKKGGRKNE